MQVESLNGQHVVPDDMDYSSIQCYKNGNHTTNSLDAAPEIRDNTSSHSDDSQFSNLTNCLDKVPSPGNSKRAVKRESDEFMNYSSDLASPSVHSTDSGKKKRRCDKMCSVCGDKAMGFNFGAITCESCKAFFRRNALKPEVPPCNFEQNCKIDVNTRRFCTYCRLHKCYSVSMKKEYILDENERRERQEKVRVNREKRRQQTSSGTGPSPERFVASLIDGSSSIIPVKLNGVSLSPGNTPSVPPVFRDTLNTTISSSFLHQQLPTASNCQIQDVIYPEIENSDRPVTGEVSLNDSLSKRGEAWLLTVDQWTAIKDLRDAYDTSFSNMISDKAPDQGNFTINNLINTSEFIVRKLINFAKKLSDFTVLDQDTQINLLKGVVLNTLFLRSANHYDVQKDVWLTPNGEIPTRILMEATGHSVLYEEHAKYCRTFREIVGDDSTLIALMQVLCLFSPEKPEIKTRQQISNIHDRYILLLKHYVEARCGYSAARHLLPQILLNLSELQRLTENHGNLLLQVDPHRVEPLMLEVFNLNDKALFTYKNLSSNSSLITISASSSSGAAATSHSVTDSNNNRNDRSSHSSATTVQSSGLTAIGNYQASSTSNVIYTDSFSSINETATQNFSYTIS